MTRLSACSWFADVIQFDYISGALVARAQHTLPFWDPEDIGYADMPIARKSAVR